MEHASFNTLDLRTVPMEEQRLFFGPGHGIARYDVVKHPILLKINEKMQSQFWRPVEIDMSMEKASFEKMTDSEQFVFTSNLRRQILLDSLQGRAPSLVFLPHCTDPAAENCIQTWSFFETIHSESYTHNIRAIYPNPSTVFDGMGEIKEIADCAGSITKAYNAMINNPSKENLYLALVSANALEALRFYVSFACTFSLAQRGFVDGSAKNIRYIARDEQQHLVFVNHLIKLLPKDDPDFIQIIPDLAAEAIKIFDEAADQERSWIDYLMSQGSVIGINKDILNRYVDYLLPRRKAAIGLSTKGSKRVEHPIDWIEDWFRPERVQVALQETEAPDYVVSTLKNNIGDLDFGGFIL